LSGRRARPARRLRNRCAVGRHFVRRDGERVSVSSHPRASARDRQQRPVRRATSLSGSLPSRASSFFLQGGVAGLTGGFLPAARLARRCRSTRSGGHRTPRRAAL